MSYQDDLKRHLIEYKNECLGIEEPGVFRYRGRHIFYEHVLPLKDSSLNLLPEARAFPDFYRAVKLHRYFHHLNSSQAFAINLFFPFFSGGSAPASALLRAIGSADGLGRWCPEWVPDTIEGTNIDMCWWTVDGVQNICEVKLSESEFGKARDDARHREKYNIYCEKLRAHLAPERLERRAFFDAYQFNRNVYHMICDDRALLIFLLPRANVVLWKLLEKFLTGVLPATRERISVAAIETVLEQLCSDGDCPEAMREYAARLKRKYVIQRGSPGAAS